MFGARGGEQIEGTPRVPTPFSEPRRGAEGKGGPGRTRATHSRRAGEHGEAPPLALSEHRGTRLRPNLPSATSWLSVAAIVEGIADLDGLRPLHHDYWWSRPVAIGLDGRLALHRWREEGRPVHPPLRQRALPPAIRIAFDPALFRNLDPWNGRFAYLLAFASAPGLFIQQRRHHIPVAMGAGALAGR